MPYSTALKIESFFLVLGRGLILIPALSIYEMNIFRIFNDNIEITLPDGTRKLYAAQFLLEHFTFADEKSKYGLRGEMRIVILLPNATGNDVPEGSEVFVNEETASRLELA